MSASAKASPQAMTVAVSSTTDSPSLAANSLTSTTTTTTTTTTVTTTSICTTTHTPPVVVNFKVSLDVPLMKAEQLYPTPSIKDNLPFDVEFDLRLTGCELIQLSGRLLLLPQTAMATGQVLFHRFYYAKSFVKNSMEYYAMACIYLSSKIEECPRSVRDIMNVFTNIKQIRKGEPIRPMPIDERYYENKNHVIKAERRILKELGFCVHVKHPHKIIFIYLQAMACLQSNLAQKAWNYMNDALRTDVFLRYSPEIIACACIYLSARELQISLPENPPWYLIFGADQASLDAICVRILHLYTHKKRTQEELESIVDQCREALERERIRQREEAAAAKSAVGSQTTSTAVTTTSSGESKTESTVGNEAVKAAVEKIKQLSSNLAAAEQAANKPKDSKHLTNNNHHHSSMTRHSSFNNQPYTYMDHQPMPAHHFHASKHPPSMHYAPYPGAPPGYLPPPPPHYNGSHHDYYNYHEMRYEHDEAHYESGGMRRNKSSSYLIDSSRYADDYYYKRERGDSRDPRYKESRSKGRSDRSSSQSKSRSRSPLSKRKLKDKKSRHRRSRSRSVDSNSLDSDNNTALSPVSKSKKKKHHRHHSREHHRHKSSEKSGDSKSSRDRHQRREESSKSSRDRDSRNNEHHSKSSRSSHRESQRSEKSSRSGGSGSNADAHYVPVYS